MEFTRLCTCKMEEPGYFEGLENQWEMIYCKIDDYIAQGDKVVAIGNCH